MVAILLHGVLPGDPQKSTPLPFSLPQKVKEILHLNNSQYAFYSAMSNLNFDIYHVHLNN